MILSEACEKFLSHCRSAVSLSQHTLRAYGGDLRNIEKHVGRRKRLSDVGKEDLRQYIRHLREEQKLKESSIKRRIACAKLLFKWAQQETIVDLNPFDTLNERLRLPRRLPRALDSIDASLLLKAVARTSSKECYELACKKAAIYLLLETGIRVGELASICVDDLSLSDRCIKIQGKGNRQRLVYLLSSSAHQVLERFLCRRLSVESSSRRLFVTAGGKDVTPPRVREYLREIVAQGGIKTHITPHMLRHTCATRWLEAGLDIRYVQKLLGHHSISTTEIYTHVSDQGLRDALTRALGGGKR